MSLAVVDASIVGPLIFEDEQPDLTPELEAALVSHQCLTTAHWRLEVANLLLMGVRRGRALLAEEKRALDLLDSLGLEQDADTAGKAWPETYALATRHQLTIYDAAYLELAVRSSATLVTFDMRLREAAVVEGVELIPSQL